mmetsp:Transcript_131642/g.228872  ORF Transcript_131642/g.228872 Transcript_131642/m.228872 type:complete len:209 (-) Transcript_131642:433-1059(-)
MEPFMVTSPDRFGISESSALSSELFPEPTLPTTAQSCPASPTTEMSRKENVAFSSTFSSLVPSFSASSLPWSVTFSPLPLPPLPCSSSLLWSSPFEGFASSLLFAVPLPLPLPLPLTGALSSTGAPTSHSNVPLFISARVCPAASVAPLESASFSSRRRYRCKRVVVDFKSIQPFMPPGSITKGFLIRLRSARPVKTFAGVKSSLLSA